MRVTVSAMTLVLALLIPPSAFAATPTTTTPAPPPATQRVPDAEIVRQVDTYLKAAMAHERFRGSILIARNGVPIVNRGYGPANEEWAEPNTPETVFRIGSVTKQFTAMAILQLRDRGALALTDSLCTYVSPCPDTWRPITLRHLLTHTSGVPNYTSLPDWDERISRLPHTHSALVGEFSQLPLDFAPGEKFRYSNSGYYLLGMVIERVTGQPYADVLQKNIFAPLGMTHTGYDRHRDVLPRRAAGYSWSGNRFVNADDINVDLAFSAGALVSTTGDLLRWDQALNSERLVSRRTLEEIFTPEKNGYGYGWNIGDNVGHRHIGHGGSIHGFSAYISRYPDDRVTIIVLSNSQATSATRLAKNLAAITFGAPVTMPTPVLADQLWKTITTQGVAAAASQYRALRRAPADGIDLGEDRLNDLGYDLLKNARTADAIAIFELGVETFPQSANAHDSLGEAYLQAGQRDLAARHYRQSLVLDPKNANAARMLDELKNAGQP